MSLHHPDGLDICTDPHGSQMTHSADLSDYLEIFIKRPHQRLHGLPGYLVLAFVFPLKMNWNMFGDLLNF